MNNVKRAIVITLLRKPDATTHEDIPWEFRDRCHEIFVSWVKELNSNHPIRDTLIKEFGHDL